MGTKSSKPKLRLQVALALVVAAIAAVTPTALGAHGNGSHVADPCCGGGGP